MWCFTQVKSITFDALQIKKCGYQQRTTKHKLFVYIRCALSSVSSKSSMLPRDPADRRTATVKKKFVTKYQAQLYITDDR